METEYKYYIHVQREFRDDDYTIHQSFTQEMTEGEIVDWLHDYDHPYDPDYNKLTFYKV